MGFKEKGMNGMNDVKEAMESVSSAVQEKTQVLGSKAVKMGRRLLTFLICVVIGIGIGVALTLYIQRPAGAVDPEDAPKNEDHVDITISHLESVLESASDMITTRYYYKDADTYENYKEFMGLKVPFTTDKAVFTYSGTVSIGIDLSAVVYEIDNERRVITVNLPEMSILANEIDTDSFEYPLLEDSVFNVTDMEDYTAMLTTLKEEKVTEVLSNTELLEQAREKTEEVFMQLLEASDVTQQYEIIIQ